MVFGRVPIEIQKVRELQQNNPGMGDAETGQEVVKGHTASVWSILAFSPDGTRIISGSSDKTIWIDCRKDNHICTELLSGDAMQ
jgi:WD40 repeat protein